MNPVYLLLPACLAGPVFVSRLVIGVGDWMDGSKIEWDSYWHGCAHIILCNSQLSKWSKKDEAQKKKKKKKWRPLIFWFVFLWFSFGSSHHGRREWRPAESLRHVSPPYRSDSSPSSLLCVVQRDPVFISACKWGRRRSAAPWAEQLKPDSKNIPPPRVDRRKKEKNETNGKFRFAFREGGDTHHVGQLRYVVGNDQFNMRMREKKRKEEDWEMDDGGHQQVKGADSEWMNEHFATPFFFLL